MGLKSTSSTTRECTSPLGAFKGVNCCARRCLDRSLAKICVAGSMGTVKDHLVKWRLRSPSLIAQTPTSDVYKVLRANGKTAILKHWTKIGRRDEANSNTILKWWRGQGAVRLYDCDDEGQLLEYADGKTLGEETRGEKLSDKEAISVVCELIKKLHAPKRRHPRTSALSRATTIGPRGVH